MTSYKESLSVEHRREESNRILTKFPERVPVILERSDKSMDIANLDKSKFLVPSDLTMGQFLYVVRRRLSLPKEQAIFLFCGGKSIIYSFIFMQSNNFKTKPNNTLLPFFPQ